jgi:tRNA-splicing ligase RtcB (3'-phosphate/5'-hydroxy nucleic acid ligase)
MTPHSTSKLCTFLAGPLSPELARMQATLVSIEDVVRVALMPDAHVADGVCVGTVLGSRQGLYPDAVGSDIGCGMLAVRLSATFASLRRGKNAQAALEGFGRRIPVNKWPVRQPVPDTVQSRTSPPFSSLLEHDGAVQFGTLGRGNHFLELDYSDDGEVWLLLHSGSRSIGPKIRAHFREQALQSGPELGHSTVPGLDAESPHGRDYLNACELALAYAEANRQRLLALALESLFDSLGVEGASGEPISCVHNFVRSEAVDETCLWIHRKGALSARHGELGIIPGSMGTESFLVEGRGNPLGLFSSSHGAGRVRSRADAFRRVSVRQLEREMGNVAYAREASKLLVDEAPSNYKPIATVMRAQRDLTRIRQRLRPWVVYKGV